MGLRCDVGSQSAVVDNFRAYLLISNFEASRPSRPSPHNTPAEFHTRSPEIKVLTYYHARDQAIHNE